MNRAFLKRLIRAGWLAVLNMQKGEDIYPFYASFKINDTCANRCSFCNVWRRSSHDTLQTHQIIRILDNIKSSSVLVISFEGGEPLFRKDLPAILRHSKRLGFLTEVTTSGLGIDYSFMMECCKYLDFLHISIDDDHNNLELLGSLKRFKKNSQSRVAIQVVVTRESLCTIEEKVKAAYTANIAVIIMPAVHVRGTADYCPDPRQFKEVVLDLRRKYPGVILTPRRFLNSIAGKGKCTASSVVIDSDGRLYYPCSVLEDKPASLLDSSLVEFLESPTAYECRNVAKSCEKRCGWYQYFATPSCRDPISFVSFIGMYARYIVGYHFVRSTS